MKDVTFGQYYPIDSAVSKLDPRIKILSAIAFIVGIFIAESAWAQVISALFIISVIAMAKLPPKIVMKSVKPILVLVCFTAVLNLFFYTQGEVIFSFWFLKIYDGALAFAVLMAIRLILLVMGTSLLTLTTQPVALTDGIESLLSPLKVIKFPVHELALIMSIALRFIPTLMDETDRIIRAQTARGAKFDSGNVLQRAKAMIPILIPLLVSSFRRADELADAMDSRCYSGGQNRTKMKKMEIHFDDIITCIYMATYVLFVIAINMLQI
ncbi:MAG: energy-coupling factor transporter transmembrane component T [Bacillota bacterium]